MEVYGVFLCLALPLAAWYPEEAGAAILLDTGVTCVYRALRTGKKKEKKNRWFADGVCCLESLFSLLFLSRTAAGYIRKPAAWPVLGAVFLAFVFLGRQKANRYSLPGEDGFRKLWENITVICLSIVLVLQYKNITWNKFFEIPEMCPWVVLGLAAAFWLLQMPYRPGLLAWCLFYLTVKVLFQVLPPKVLSMDGQPFLNLGRCAKDFSGGAVRMEIPVALLFWGMLFFILWEGSDRLWKKKAGITG